MPATCGSLVPMSCFDRETYELRSALDQYDAALTLGGSICAMEHSGESGALKEEASDTFGEPIEDYQDNKTMDGSRDSPRTGA